jgi:hypothetical protein
VTAYTRPEVENIAVNTLHMQCGGLVDLRPEHGGQVGIKSISRSRADRPFSPLTPSTGGYYSVYQHIAWKSILSVVYEQNSYSST